MATATVVVAMKPGTASFLSPHAQPIELHPDGSLVYVVNTPSGTVDVIDTLGRQIVDRIAVGVEPVGIAIRPDGLEVWVTNHLSDSVSVIDSDPSSRTFHHVVDTVQLFHSASRSTRFDEPVGVAFANNAKAYVALSSTNKIAVVRVKTRKVTKRLEIAAQDPRAITVRGNRLYVVAFESGNQTELAGCFEFQGGIDGDQCTFDLGEHVVDNNNVLSLGYDADIVRDPRVPDRDLFVFDTKNESLVDVVSSVGTLLYGVAVDSDGKVFISQTEARNDANGRAGTKKHELRDLENRAFLNQIGVVSCKGASCGKPSAFDLEPLPPNNPKQGMALATPFGIQVSGDDSTLAVTAAGSDKLFTVDTATGDVLGRVKVQAVPRGVALASAASGAPLTAWVLNAVENSVSMVNVAAPTRPSVLKTIRLKDPTDPVVKAGRAAFNNAEDGSTTGTFSCESCHPDGHTDQLLWVLGGPQCTTAGCTQIPPRSTLPVRGVRDTAPYHWDGVPGDPFGGINGEFPGTFRAPNCTTPESCIRNVIDGGLASTMCEQGNCRRNRAGQRGPLEAGQRSAMGEFLLTILHPPGRERPYDDQLTALAKRGFFEFHDNGGRETCGRCHQFPFWTSSNTPGSGMDAPSFRGLPDRWLILPQGRINMWELVSVTSRETNEFPFDAAKGFDELSMWGMTIGTAQNPTDNRMNSGWGPRGPWQMFLEGSMGTSGAFGRQVTLNHRTWDNPLTAKLLDALETNAADGAILLVTEGVRLDGALPVSVGFVFKPGSRRYKASDGSGLWTREDLLTAASARDLVVTLTGQLPPKVGPDRPQPGIWGRPVTPGAHQVVQDLPRLPQDNPMRIFGRHLFPGSRIFVDGRRVAGSAVCDRGGTLPNCTDEAIRVRLVSPPAEPGLHLIQLQSPQGLLSNDFIFYVD
ncbi:MAG: hypothetical protein VYE73_11495 [Acidobacteriota bacterium]|nr:hypothetical protein [Acidobacteriota bacterium]